MEVPLYWVSVTRVIDTNPLSFLNDVWLDKTEQCYSNKLM